MVKNSCKLVDEQLIKASIRIPRYSASGTAIFGPLVQTNLAQRVHDEVRRRTNIFLKRLAKDVLRPHEAAWQRMNSSLLEASQHSPQFHFQISQWPPSPYLMPSEVLLLPPDLGLEALNV